MSAGSDACAVTDTGRECGTSASSAPSRTTSWTPSASARSTTTREKPRQRIAGSGPESSTRSRGARGTRAAWISNSGHSILRVVPSTSRTTGRVDWKSTKSSGSMTANGSAPRPPATNDSAEVADSPASFQPLKAQTSAGARRPSGRRSQRNGCIGSRYRVRRVAQYWTVIASTPTIAALRAGDPVDAVFACSRKDRLMARSGVPYLALELRDKTGAIPARAFRDADVLAGRFERGDLVRVQGRVERFREELQLEVRDISRATESDPAAFLPVAYRDLDELDGFLEHLAREVHDPGYRGLLDRLISDPGLRAEWRRAPCTRAGHHAYLGGLLEHTVAVGTLALECAQLHPRLNPDLLLTV